MSYLYCIEHGQEKRSQIEKINWKHYPGEYAKIAEGLLTASYRCDECNKILNNETEAMLICYYQDGYSDSLEHKYFNKSDVVFLPENRAEDQASITPPMIEKDNHSFTLQIQENTLHKNPRLLSFSVSLASNVSGHKHTALSDRRFFIIDHSDMLFLKDYFENHRLFNLKSHSDKDNKVLEIGSSIWDHLFFSHQDTAEIWRTIRENLQKLKVEIIPESARGHAYPWELMVPNGQPPLALFCNSFTRKPKDIAPQKKAITNLDSLRVLLVTCRQSARDIPEDAIITMLTAMLNKLKGKVDIQFEHIKSATYKNIEHHLLEALKNGNPFHIVHFDGHGLYQTKEKRGYIIFEDEHSYDSFDLVDGDRFGKILEEAGVSYLVLNACESAQTTTPELLSPLTTPSPVWPMTQEKGFPFHVSVMKYGVAGVVAMRYKVSLTMAQCFYCGFYSSLQKGDDFIKAATFGRKALATTAEDLNSAGRNLHDWSIPVVYEARYND